MPRLPRIHVPGGFYHVTLRGNHRQAIFFCNADRQFLDATVAEIIEQCGARVHAYCWMTNHIHLLIEVSATPLGAIMLRIASRYARTVQSRLSTTGHLFERRYHALLVDADSYLLELLRYIHLNPVRARMVDDLSKYRWSSHQVYAGERNDAWITTDFALRMFHNSRTPAIEAYLQFMRNGADSTEESGFLTGHPQDTRVLGDDRFLIRTIGTQWKPRSSETLDAVIAQCCSRFGITADLLVSPSKARHLVAARAWVAHRATRGRIASICAVARQFNRCESAIRQIMAHPFVDT